MSSIKKKTWTYTRHILSSHKIYFQLISVVTLNVRFSGPDRMETEWVTRQGNLSGNKDQREGRQNKE